MKYSDLENLYYNNKLDQVHEYFQNIDVTLTSEYTPHNTLVHLASLMADAKGLEILLTRDANVNEANAYQDRPIHLLLKNEERNSISKIVDSLNILLKYQVSLIRKNSQGQIPLHIASERGNYECVRILCEKGSKVNLKDNNGYSPLMLLVSRYGSFASIQDYDSSVEILLKHDADIQLQNDYGESPFEFALKYHNGSNLLKLFKDSNEVNQNYTEQNLFTLIKNGAYEELQKVLESDVNVNFISDEENETRLMSPLAYAITKFDDKSVKLLIDHGADVMLVNSLNEGCLSFIFKKEHIINFTFDVAAEKRLQKILTSLYEKGFDFNVSIDDFGTTLLIASCKEIHSTMLINNQNVQTIIIDYLLAKNININATDAHGKSALMYLVEKGNFNQSDYLYALLEKGAALDLIDQQGNTVLIYACSNPKNPVALEFAQILMEFDNYLIEHVNNNQESALSIAVAKNNEKLVTLLLTK
ncbi:ankyrin repeat domain-containing protein [Mycoplasmopsis columboralis]|uniref:Uroporphyrinogen-III decarboxylase n=1 Tax=Mycoplasmopsis columboralis TaxID=171282 RepID=A0A449B666_9BACT|nr:ankyrin repeat domain-containing protein [Mycoplasmopsis columboralis]VEU76008.1 Uroporphyrinogen-III decarboxylase [Mycoplasmopsis columboralis]